jgi:hypothetical protein
MNTKTLLIVLISIFFICGCEQDLKYVDEHITDRECGATPKCPEGLECWFLGDSDYDTPRCVDPNPEEWYCEEGTMPGAYYSIPPTIGCYPPEETTGE